MDKNKSLNEVVEAISLEKGEYLNKDFICSKIQLLLPQPKEKKLDYSKLFSYLGNNVKENSYITYTSEKIIKKKENNSKKKDVITYTEVVDIVKTSKIDRLLGRNIEFINPLVKEKFDNFKIFNQQYVMLLYQVVGM
jgi:hypothetical protein